MIGSEAQECDRLLGPHEWICHNATIPQREGRDRLTVDRRQQHRSLQFTGVVEGGDPTNDSKVVVVGESQLNP